MSAEVATVPLAVALLLAELGSDVVLFTDAESENAAPLANPLGALTTTVKLSLCPAATAAEAEAVTAPPDWEYVNESALPAEGVIDTKTEPAGSVSVRTTPGASD